jgi:hypothetical protein
MGVVIGGFGDQVIVCGLIAASTPPAPFVK